MSYRKAVILSICVCIMMGTLPVLINDFTENPTVGDWLMLLILEIACQELFILYKKENKEL